MPDESVDFYPSRAHVLLLALGALALVALCAVVAWLGFGLAQTSGSRAALAVVSVSAIGVLVFTGLGLIVLRRLLLPTWPVLTLDGDGLVDWLPNLGVEQVLWSEVTGVREARLAFRRVLAVDVADPRAVVARQRTVVRRVAASVHASLVGTPVVLKPGSIAVRPEELSATLSQFVAGRTPDTDPVA
ncbi:STM3941 family protein [Promicromonospora sp. NPDC050880]|uniref:STM3941 family protein n=1 Tax=Promicromonospora sp. NPDC050880 TaxID=3364406 RepID=UPI003795017E